MESPAPASEPRKRVALGYFGARTPCFGIAHAPAEPSDHGVVIVNDFGYRGMCVYWTLRRLADRLADAGRFTLRFDLPGTGDSPAVDGDRVASWSAAVDEAVEHVLAQEGIERVTLIGFGIGAVLALGEARRHPKVEAVELIAPFLDGARYLAFVDAIPRASGPTKALAGGRLVGDHFLSSVEERSLRALSAMGSGGDRAFEADLSALDGDDSRELEARLVRSGTSCRRHVVDDADAWLKDPMFNEMPQFFDPLVARVARRGGPTGALRSAPLRLRHTARGYEEEAIVCPGRGGEAMYGVLATPVPAPRALVVFFGTAANRRCGMHDSNTYFARALAQRGTATLRFDASGFGDSNPQPGFPDNAVLVDRSYTDAEPVLEAMRKRGFREFGTLGVSSGGFSAFKAAQRDGSVVAFFGINVARFVEETLDQAIRKGIKTSHWYVTALRDPTTWRRLLRGEINARGIATALMGRARGRAEAAVKTALGRLRGSRHVALRGEGHRDMAALLDRAPMSVHLVYAEGDQWMENFENELGARGSALAGHPRFRVTYLSDIDHGASAPADAARVAELACAFFASAFSGAGRADADAPAA